MPFSFGNEDCILVGYDDFGFIGEHLTVREYAKKMEEFQSEGIIEYNVFNYVPIWSFDQKEKDTSLKNISVYLRDTRGIKAGTVAYDYHEFYVVSGNNKADVFRCVET